MWLHFAVSLISKFLLYRESKKGYYVKLSTMGETKDCIRYMGAFYFNGKMLRM